MLVFLYMWSGLPACVCVWAESESVCHFKWFIWLSNTFFWCTVSPCSPPVFWCTPVVWFPGDFGLEHKLLWAFMWNPGSNTRWIIQHLCFIYIFFHAFLSCMSTLSFIHTCGPAFALCLKTMITIWIYQFWDVDDDLKYSFWFWKYNMLDILVTLYFKE